MIELTFLKELMLIRQVNQKSVIFVCIGILKIKGFNYKPDVFNGCYDVLMMPTLRFLINGEWGVKIKKGVEYFC